MPDYILCRNETAFCYYLLPYGKWQSLSKSERAAPSFSISNGFQLGLSLSYLGVEVVQLITRVFCTVRAVQYFSVNTAFSYIAHTAITKLYLTNCQATIAIDILSLEGMLKLFTPFFGDLSPGRVIVFFELPDTLGIQYKQDHNKPLFLAYFPPL
jgi:hypothetical protein